MTEQVFKVGQFSIKLELLDDRLRFSASLTPGGPSGRFLEMVDGGGHIELTCPGSITTGTGLELDEGGHAVFHLE